MLDIRSIGLKYVKPNAIWIAPFLEAKASWYCPLGIYNKSPGFNVTWSINFPALLSLSSGLILKTGWLIGQFSISFYDGNTNELFLIRDRLGQKPLFYTHNNNEIVFGSNLKSLVLMNKEYVIDSNSLGEFLDLGVVTSPKTIFKNFYKLQPSEFIIFDLNTYQVKTQIKRGCWCWYC